VYNPKTKTCQKQKFCSNPQTGKNIKYFGSRKPLLCFRPPKAITKPARHVRPHSAVIPGVVIDPHHFRTHWYFLWGVQGPRQQAGGAQGRCHLNHRTRGGYVHKRTPVRITLHHLHPRTTYCYRLVDHNKRGTGRGAIRHFRAKGQPPPKPITGPSRGVHRRTVVITGVVLDPNHFRTHWYFVWGACPALNHRTKGGYVYKRTPVSVTLHNLNPGTVYCYELVEHNKGGTSIGTDRRLRTTIAKPPKKPHGFTG
jgi:hypothetical protein